MIPREVTVGRAPDNDIQYSPQCMMVSNHHALVYSDGKALLFKDTSTNGTWINNMKVHKQTIVIHHGDNILLAGKYPLSWDKLNMYFPISQYGMPMTGGGTMINQSGGATMYGGNDQMPNYAQKPSTSQQQDQYKVDVEITRFNWGAFFLYPYWGFANGMWWLFFISFFTSWLAPFSNLLFGIMGSKWAWKAKQWRDINHFVEVQNSWKKWGIGIFVGFVILFVIVFAVAYSVAISR
jgi:hypothetical protein